MCDKRQTNHEGRVCRSGRELYLNAVVIFFSLAKPERIIATWHPYSQYSQHLCPKMTVFWTTSTVLAGDPKMKTYYIYSWIIMEIILLYKLCTWLKKMKRSRMRQKESQGPTREAEGEWRDYKVSRLWTACNFFAVAVYGQANWRLRQKGVGEGSNAIWTSVPFSSGPLFAGDSIYFCN